MVDPCKCLQIYLSVKAHFATEKHNALTHNGRMANITYDVLDQRADSGLIRQVARKFDDMQSLSTFFVANMAAGNVHPFSDLDRAQALYTEWLKIKHRLTRQFTDDCNAIVDTNQRFDVLIATSAGQLPPLFLMMKNQRISLQSLAIIDVLHPVSKTWQGEHPIWKSDFMRIRKARSFLPTRDPRLLAIFNNTKDELNQTC